MRRLNCDGCGDEIEYSLQRRYVNAVETSTHTAPDGQGHGCVTLHAVVTCSWGCLAEVIEARRAIGEVDGSDR